MQQQEQQAGAVNLESSPHVPQQIKRTKLRHILLHQTQPSSATMKPSYPPPHFPHFATTPSKTVSMNYDATVLTDNHHYSNTSSDNITYLSHQHQQQQEGLCLSLSSQSHQQNNNPVMSDMMVSTRSDFSASSVPLGPFTGYASVLNRSRLLKPAQQLLDDFCYGSRVDVELPPPHCSGGKAAWICCDAENEIPVPQQHKWNTNNSSLIQLLEEVFKRYKLYCQQIQSVVASFESVSGLGNAAPYFIFAFKTMSKHFTCLKTAIVEQVQRSGNSQGNDRESQTLMASSVNRRPVKDSSFLKHHVWRSQRGLPSRAVVVLKKWLFEHFLHPYPSDADKQMLAQQTGLSKTQVSNWFINARVRLWKPMVEEIHGLEAHKVPVPSEPRSPRAIQLMSYQISSNALSLKPSSLMYRTNVEEEVDISGASAYRRRAADNADVSLALGLEQNHFPGGRAFLHGHMLPSWQGNSK